MVSAFNFTSSSLFLRSYIESLPKKGWGEIQRWADHLSVQPSYISQVLAGTKNFNIDQCLKLSRHLGLKSLELEYLMTLFEQERAGSHETKKYYEEKLKTLKAKSRDLSKRLPKDLEFSEAEKSVFYSTWIYSAIRVYCSIGKGKTLNQISERFLLSRHDAMTLLEFLCSTGLCAEKKGVYTVGIQKTHLNRKSPHIHRHRQNWRVKALTQIDKVAEDELVYSAPFSISQKDFEILKEEISKLLERFTERIQNTEPEEMAFLNVDLMKLR